MEKNTLIVITGPTASGKSAIAVELALRLGCEIISADSRQVYRDLPIGTAAPSAVDRAAVPHHLVGFLPLQAAYSAAAFEADVAGLLPGLWERSPYAVLCGGSMMYVDAVTDGLDRLPDIPDDTRRRVLDIIGREGVDAALDMLRRLDPVYAAQVDAVNPRRVAHALEICIAAGRPYSELRGNGRTDRPYRIVKVAVMRQRHELFDRINRRVDSMLEAGWLDEARRVLPMRGCNSLNTVGYKELFTHFDGLMSLDEARARIAKNTRVYAKKQLTWLARPSVRPSIPVTSADDILELL